MHLIQSVQRLLKLWPYRTTDIHPCNHIIHQSSITLVTDAHDFFKWGYLKDKLKPIHTWKNWKKTYNFQHFISVDNYKTWTTSCLGVADVWWRTLSVVSCNASEFQHTRSLHFSITTPDLMGNTEINAVFMLSEKGHTMKKPENTLPVCIKMLLFSYHRNNREHKRIQSNLLQILLVNMCQSKQYATLCTWFHSSHPIFLKAHRSTEFLIWVLFLYSDTDKNSNRIMLNVLKLPWCKLHKVFSGWQLWQTVQINSFRHLTSAPAPATSQWISSTPLPRAL